VVSLATTNCSLVLSFLQFLFPLSQFALLLNVDGKNSFNVSIGLASVQVTYALLHLQEIPRFVNPRSKGIASAQPSTNLVD
jgi:hypothetical protein